MSKLRIDSVLEHGVFQSLRIARKLLLRKILWKLLDKHFVTISGVRREMLGEILISQSNGEVKSGHFKGMKIKKLSWGARDIGPMVLGTYELEVQETIMQAPSSYRTFVDIGAADGFYGIGLTFNGRFDRAFCFESSPKSQEAIRLNSEANGVTSKVIILGRAEENFHKILTEENKFKPEEMLLLIDIEGGEFEILNYSTLAALKKSFFVIEIHEFVDDFETKYEKLVNEASDFFDVHLIDSSDRKQSNEPLIADWPDEDRQIIFSEGRRYMMQWLVLIPKIV